MSKHVNEECERLDITWLARNDYIPARPGERRGGPVHWQRPGELEGGSGRVGIAATYEQLTISYSYTGDDGEQKLDGTQTVQLARSPMPRGGQRVWALCPECGERVGVLYLARREGKLVFACRRCQGIIYASQLTHDRDYYRYSPWLGIERYAWGRKIIAAAQAEASRVKQEQAEQREQEQQAAQKRGRGRPKTKRKYVRRSLVSPAADVPACPTCGQPIPAARGVA
jgi:hypothetical protein